MSIACLPNFMNTVMFAKYRQGTNQPARHRYDVPPSLNDYENPLNSLTTASPSDCLKRLAQRSESKSKQEGFAFEGTLS